MMDGGPARTAAAPPPPVAAGATRAPGGRMERPLVGAVDLGSTCCRMGVAEVRPSGRYRVVERFSRITRLGEGLGASGRLSDSAMERSLSVLLQCASAMRDRGVSRVRAVTTQATRVAGNGADFARRVAAETGLALEIIAPEEEARLALAGCASLLDPNRPYALVFDIGGASSELMWVRVTPHGARLLESRSLPLGVISLTERMSDYDAAVEEVCRALAGIDAACGIARKARAGRVQMLGTSGTVTTLAGIHMGLPRYDRRKVDGRVVSFPAFEEATLKLRRMSLSDRARHPCVGRDRARFLMAGCAILEALRTVWPVGQIRVADRGVREGRSDRRNPFDREGRTPAQ